jgi:chitinase
MATSASSSPSGAPPRPLFLLTATTYFSSDVFTTLHLDVDYPSEDLARCLNWVNVAAFVLRRLSQHHDGLRRAALRQASHFSASYDIVC